MLDDVNVMNSAAWKPVTVTGSPGGTWSFGMSGSGTYPNIGFAIDAWEGATQTIIAQEIPVVEFSSPDGRCLLSAKASELLPGLWQYEYALLNIDMDRQVGSFSVPIPPGTTVTQATVKCARHHDEPFNTKDPDQVAIDNLPWTLNIGSDSVTWSTTSNPIRWSTLYNFRFRADAPPDTVTATFGLFRPGTPTELTGQTVGPTPAPCIADTDGNGVVDVDDLTAVILDWGTDGSGNNGDVDGSGVVDVDDLTEIILGWGPC
jgi:hypothetical protein